MVSLICSLIACCCCRSRVQGLPLHWCILALSSPSIFSLLFIEGIPLFAIHEQLKTSESIFILILDRLMNYLLVQNSHLNSVDGSSSLKINHSLEVPLGLQASGHKNF